MKSARQLHQLYGKTLETLRIQEHMGTRTGEAKFSPQALREHFGTQPTAHVDFDVPAPGHRCALSSCVMIDALTNRHRHVFHLALSTGFRHDWCRLTSRVNNGVHTITSATLQ